MRLIDADMLIEMLRHDIDCYDTGKPDDKIYINAKDVINMIKGQPTAHDGDKAVERLEERYLMCICPNNESCDYPEKIGCCYDKAVKDCIEIAKAEFERCGKPESEG